MSTSRRSFRVAARLAAVLALVLLGDATPAAADAAGPGDYRSEVTGIEPDVPGVSAEILGGDSFLELTVERGHTVIVEGYQEEPYLRFRPDGTVERNRLSSATYLNDDRKARVTIPPDVRAAMEDPRTDPEWVEVASGGTYAWHDHRVHWMAAVPPPVERGERVTGAYDPWRIPIEVDGTRAEVQGTLTYASAAAPLPWAALGVVVCAALAWAGRGRALRLPAAILAVASVAAVVVGRADWAATPGGGNPLLWILPAIALVTAAAAVAVAPRGAAAVLSLASVAALSGWALLRLAVLLEPVLPTQLPFVVDRATVAGALGVSAAAAYLVVTSGALALPALDDE